MNITAGERKQKPPDFDKGEKVGNKVMTNGFKLYCFTGIDSFDAKELPVECHVCNLLPSE